MKLIKTGKTKDVYSLESGHVLLKFKDSVTGGPGGQVDPGGNDVVGEIAGMGQACLGMTTYLFERIADQNLTPCHFVSANLAENTMEVRPAQLFGQGLEIVIRFIATGSFVRRYGQYIKDGHKFSEPLVEITLKDDQLGDPLINDEALVALSLINAEELKQIKDGAKKVAAMVERELAEKGLTLYDMKVEFGRGPDGQIMLIDEISPGCMRAFKGQERVQGPKLAAYFVN